MRVMYLKKRTGALILSIVLALFLAVPVCGAESAPAQVLQSRNGVVRIVSIYNGLGWASGTGFVVGTEDDYYVITNHHVTEDSDEVRVAYDTGKYLEAEIYADFPEKDLCILKIKGNKEIPDMQILPLQTERFDIGAAAYALGYPGSADLLAGDLNRDPNEVTADKGSMTITGGIISAVRGSTLIGNRTREVRVVQSDTAINRGNSGGPLLDSNGNVIGINTVIIVANLDGSPVSGTSGSIHVSELIAELREAGIRFYDSVDALDARGRDDLALPEIDDSGNWFTPFIIGVVAVAVVLVVFILIIYHKKNKKLESKGQ